MKKNKKVLILALVAVLVIATCVACYFIFRPSTVEGEKTISVQIVKAADDTKTVEITTTSEFLRGALDEQELVVGEEGEFGLFIKTVDGRTVDDTKQEWWCVTKGGAEVTTGVEMTPIADGDVFELTLKTGW